VKQTIRREMAEVLAAMPPAEAQAGSVRACAAAGALEEFLAAGSVLFYHPIPGELDCLPLVREAWRLGKAVLLPKVSRAERRMAAFRWRSPEDEMTAGSYGIREPARGEPWPLGELDLVIVPVLACDRRGLRLGRGGGYYDRFLAQDSLRATTCGLAFARQVVDVLPAEAHDVPVEIVVTDRDVLRINKYSHGPPAGRRPGIAPPPRRRTRET